MVWLQDVKLIESYLAKLLCGVSSCDLCGANVNSNLVLGEALSQGLLCQYCVNDLPYFKQEIIAGDLLGWPAVQRALPNIHFEHLFSLFPYIYPLDNWLAQLKYSGRFELAHLFSALLSARWQAMAKKNELTPIDLVIPVPLHIKKWQIRGYNQAHLIAKLFAGQLALPYDSKLLIRIKNNASQMGKTGTERRRNLANAFAVQKALSRNIKHVLLVDDVVTTGTTASEICKVLKQSGVETVTLVTVCLTLPKMNKRN